MTPISRAGRRPPRSVAGFTFIELLAVLFIIGLVIVSATPYIQEGVKQGQANAAARELWADLGFARSLAVKTGFPHLFELCAGSQPGYMVVECQAGGTGDYTAPACNGGIDVCAEVGADGASGNTAVRRERNLQQGRYTSGGSAADYTGVAFGHVGGAIGSAPDAPSGSIPSSGIDLGCGNGAAGANRRFFFIKTGQAVSDTPARTPCSGTFYLVNRLDQYQESALSDVGDPELNRAVQFTSAGGLRVFKHQGSGWQ